MQRLSVANQRGKAVRVLGTASSSADLTELYYLGLGLYFKSTLDYQVITIA